jgi:hypothetical protein
MPDIYTQIMICHYFHLKYILCLICFQLFISIALLPKELVFSSHWTEKVFHIEAGTEAKSVEEDIWAQVGCNKGVVMAV